MKFDQMMRLNHLPVIIDITHQSELKENLVLRSFLKTHFRIEIMRCDEDHEKSKNRMGKLKSFYRVTFEKKWFVVLVKDVINRLVV